MTYFPFILCLLLLVAGMLTSRKAPQAGRILIICGLVGSVLLVGWKVLGRTGPGKVDPVSIQQAVGSALAKALLEDQLEVGPVLVLTYPLTPTKTREASRARLEKLQEELISQGFELILAGPLHFDKRQPPEDGFVVLAPQTKGKEGLELVQLCKDTTPVAVVSLLPQLSELLAYRVHKLPGNPPCYGYMEPDMPMGDTLTGSWKRFRALLVPGRRGEACSLLRAE